MAQIVTHAVFRLLAAVVMLISTATTSNAAIVFSTPTNININTPTQVRNDGTLFQAWSAVGPLTVNGVNFAGVGLPTSGFPNPATYGNLRFTGFTQINVDAFGSTLQATNYGKLLNGAIYSEGASATVTINNLTVGRDYLVQLWANDDRGPRSQTISSTGGNSRSMSLGALNTAGQFVTGQFTAGSTSEQFSLSGAFLPQINMMQVRDISITAVPEPSSMLLLAVGSVGMGYFGRRRFRKSATRLPARANVCP